VGCDGSSKNDKSDAHQPRGHSGAPGTSSGNGTSVAPGSSPSNAAPKLELFASNKRFDVLIRGGQVIDGTGRPPFEADVLLDGDRIVHVGPVDTAVTARRTIDAKGMVVTPGFIDTHAHGDPAGQNNNSLAQGVTTLCFGLDGRSPSNDRIEYWVKKYRRKRLRTNAVALVGHGTVRGLAKVGIAKDLSDRQRSKMAKVVRKEMAAGAFGLSLGLEYQPGSFASTQELVEIAKPVAEYDGIVMSHMRSEDDDKIEQALDELIAQGKGSGARVHVSHIKVVYGRGAERAEQILAKLDQARKQGVKITANIYPYMASYTTIGIVFPDFAKPPNRYKKVVKKRREELAEYLRKRITLRGGPEKTLFGTKPHRGKTLAQVAAKRNKPFEEVLIDIGPRGGSAAYFVMDEPLQARLLTDPHVMICSDGSPWSRHPRGYGSFAKVLRKYVGEQKLLSLPEAVRKMTSLPAETIGLSRQKRGLLKAGWAADVLVFDPAKVRDRATYEKPTKYAEGMAWVFVNGRAVRKDGEFTKAKPGKVLRPARKDTR